MKKLAALAAMILTLPAWACEGLSVHDSWIPQAPPGAAVLAGYMTLDNNSARPLTVHRIESADFDSVDLHRTVIENGISKMKMLPNVTIPAHGQQKFTPGGFHLMLFKPKHPMKPGDQVILRFFCDDQQPLDAEFGVRAAP